MNRRLPAGYRCREGIRARLEEGPTRRSLPGNHEGIAMTRSKFLPLALALALPASLSAGEPDWGRAAPVHVDLSSFKFAPRTIHMKAGQPVLLHLVNTSSGGHDFTAKEFFAAASIRPGDAAKIAKGSIELAGHRSAEVALVPKAGRYPLRCGHAFHSTLGMKGAIVVE